MAESGDATPAPPETIPHDEGLRCLTCGYNLTGLADERCPECGKSFDVEALRAAFAGKPAPVPGWDDGSTSWTTAFVNTCVLTWISPSEFGRNFPTRHVRAKGLLFRVMCLAAGLTIYAGACMAVPLISGHGFPEGIVAFAVPPGVMVGAIVCEVGIALLFSSSIRRAGLRPDAGPLVAFVSWRGLAGFFRSFLMVSASLIGPCFAWSHRSAYVLMWAAIIVAIVWWWHNLSRAAMAASLPGIGRAVACIAVPFVAVLAILVGFVASFCCGLALLAVIEGL